MQLGRAAFPQTRPTKTPSPLPLSLQHPLWEPLPTRLSLPFPIIERRFHPRQSISSFNLFLEYFGVVFLGGGAVRTWLSRTQPLHVSIIAGSLVMLSAH